MYNAPQLQSDNTIPATAVRTQFANLLNRAAFRNEPVIVTRHGHPLAVLISIEEYRHYCQLKLQKPNADV